MIERVKPTLRLPFNKIKDNETALSFIKNYGGTFTRSGGATRINSKGEIEIVDSNTPRITFDKDTGENLGLLIEPTSTNLTPYWQTDANWVGLGTHPPSTQKNIVIDGMVCDSVTFNSGLSTYNETRAQGSSFPISYNHESDAGYSMKVYLKFSRQLTSTEKLWVYGTGGFSFCHIVFSGNGAEYGIGSTEWVEYKVNWVDVSSYSSGTGRITILPYNDLLTPLTVYISYRQVERNSFLTSYIPTNGSSVTRGVEYIEIPTNGWYRWDEGTYFVDISRVLGNTTFPISVGTSSQSYQAIQYSSSNFFYTRNPDVVNTISSENMWADNTKNVYGYSIPNGYYFNMDSISNTLNEKTNGTVFNNPNYQTLRINYTHWSASQSNFILRNFTYYPTIISNTHKNNLIQ